MLLQEATMATLSRSLPYEGMRFTGRNGLIDKYYYFVMSVVLATIVFWGFSYTVDARLIHPPVQVPSIIWVHTIAFSSWMCFLIFQSVLVRTHNVSIHRTVGWFGVALGTFMVPLGIATGVIMGRFEKHVMHLPGRESNLAQSFEHIIVFAIPFALAVHWRKRRDLHRTLLIATGCVFIDAGLNRVPWISGIPYKLFLTGAMVNVVFLTGALRDWLVTRRVQRIYYIFTPALAAFQAFVYFVYYWPPAWWMRFAGFVLG